MEDEQIIQKLFSRDESGLSDIEAAYGGQLYNMALQICGNRQDAEKAMNDMLQAAWDAIPPVRPRMLFAYLAGITRRLACKALRYRRAEKGAETVPFDAVMEEILPAFADGDENTAASDRADTVLALNVFLDSCSETDRAVFVRRYYTAEPVQKIADALKLTKDNVCQILRTMQETLSRQLVGKGVREKQLEKLAEIFDKIRPEYVQAVANPQSAKQSARHRAGKSVRKRGMMAIVGAVLAAVILAVFLFSGNVWNKHVRQTGTGTDSSQEGDDWTEYPGIFVVCRVFPDHNIMYCLSENGTYYAIPLEKKEIAVSRRGAHRISASIQTTSGKVMQYIGDQLLTVTESGAVYAQSLDGRTILYEEKGGSESDLCLYFSGETETVKKGFSNAADDATISPHGKAVAYSIGKKSILGATETIAYTYFNGKTEELGENCTPIMISDDAQYVYYSDGTGLYVKEKNQKKLLVSKKSEELMTLYFNRDATEILIQEVAGPAYFYRIGGEVQKLSDIQLTLHTPDPNNYQSELFPETVLQLTLHTPDPYNYQSELFPGTVLITFDLETLTGMYCDTEQSVFRIPKDGIDWRMDGNVSFLGIASDGMTAFVQKDGQIFTVDGHTESPELTLYYDVQKYAEGKRIIRFLVCENGRDAFVEFDDREIRFLNGQGEGVLVAEPHEGWIMSVLFRGNTLLYSERNTVCFSRGQKGEPVPAFSGKPVAGVDVTDKLAVFSADGYYFSTDLETFIKAEVSGDGPAIQ